MIRRKNSSKPRLVVWRFNSIWPKELGFINKPAGKKQLGEIILRCYERCGHAATVICLDKLKDLGFKSATRAGVSIGINDMIIPEEKPAVIEKSSWFSEPG